MTNALHGSLVALVTPMTDDGRIDSDAYKRLLKFHLEQGTDGLVVGGTTGESPTLTAPELELLVREAREVSGGQIPVIAGCGSNSTAHSVELTRLVCAAGANACMAVTPYYNKPTQQGLRLHFEAIAAAATVPVILYNVPLRTGCDLLPETVAQLSAVDNIVGIKEATGDVQRASEIIDRCGEGFTVLSGDDASALDLMRAGAAGVVSVTANVVPALVAGLCRAANDHDWPRAQELLKKLQPLTAALFVEANPIPVKYAMHLLGMMTATVRLPLTTLSTPHVSSLVEAMQVAGLEMSE